MATIIADIRDGILSHLSAGYEVAQWRDGQDNGQRSRTATKWVIKETSFVGVPADGTARTRNDRASINRQIRELGRRAGVPVTVTDDLVDRNATVSEARSALAFEMVERSRMPIRTAIQNDYTDPAFQTRALSDALYGKLTGIAPSGRGGELVHRSLIDLMEMHLRSQGVHLRNTVPTEVFQAAMMTRAGMHSTSDFPIVLADTMNRRLGQLFKAAESGASAIAAPGTARDFRPITEVRTTSFPSLEKVEAETGEVKWGSLDEEGETLAIASYARGISLSFQVIVNDDLTAIDRAVRDVAFATAQLKAKLIVAALGAVLKDGKATFHEDHGNLAYASGDIAAPGETTLSAGRLAMEKQTPPGSDEPLGLTPAILLVPSELRTAGEKLLASINPTASDAVNVFAGRLQLAVEPRLKTAGEWYLFAAPGTYPVIRFLTLAGYDAPRFETEQMFKHLGVSYRTHWHVGAGPIDWRGAWKNPGA